MTKGKEEEWKLQATKQKQIKMTTFREFETVKLQSVMNYMKWKHKHEDEKNEEGDWKNYEDYDDDIAMMQRQWERKTHTEEMKKKFYICLDIKYNSICIDQ